VIEDPEGAAMDLVRTERDAGIAVVTLADPERRNAISLDMADQLAQALAGLADDPQLRAVVVTGEGTAFCAGADRDALRRADEAVLRKIYDAFLLVRELPLPTVAAVNGPAVGAGFNLALACDVRIAAQSAVFDSRFVSIPIHPGGGHTWMLARATTPQVAAAMTLFGRPLDGPCAVRAGLAWACVPDGELLGAAREFCAGAAAAPARLVREIKDTLRTAPALPGHHEACEFELRRQLDSVGRPEYRERFGGGR
jgi:enoyl-CoA hydratase